MDEATPAATQLCTCHVPYPACSTAHCSSVYKGSNESLVPGDKAYSFLIYHQRQRKVASGEQYSLPRAGHLPALESIYMRAIHTTNI